MVQISHTCMTTGKTMALTIWTFANKVVSLLFTMPSRFVIAFLSRSKHLLISWLQSSSTVILEPKKIKSVTVSTIPIHLHEMMGLDVMILVFWMLSFKLAFHSPLSSSSRLFSSSLLSAIRVVSSMYLRLLIFLPAILVPAYASSTLALHMISLIHAKCSIFFSPRLLHCSFAILLCISLDVIF